MRIEYFELVSRIESLDREAGLIRCIGEVPLTGTTFEGHFPGHPLMPGVLLIECMAQSCGHLLLAQNGYTQMPFLAAVKSAKLRSFVRPGAVIAVDARLEHVGSSYAVAHADVSEAGKRVAEAELRFGLMAFPSDALRRQMLGLVKRLGGPFVPEEANA